MALQMCCVSAFVGASFLLTVNCSLIHRMLRASMPCQAGMMVVVPTTVGAHIFLISGVSGFGGHLNFL